MRGDLCPYDHGPDPVVVDDTALEKMVNIGGSGPSNKRIVPAMPNFSVPPPGYTPLNPPPPGVDSVYVPSAPVPVANEGTERFFKLMLHFIRRNVAARTYSLTINECL